MVERYNEEIRRRERVVRIFPSQESALCLIDAVLAEQHEQWQQRKYFDMSEFHAWNLARNTQAAGNIASLNQVSICPLMEPLGFHRIAPNYLRGRDRSLADPANY